MSADYDLYSGLNAYIGTEENVLMDGTNYTQSIVIGGEFKSVIFAAFLNTAALWRDLVWTVQDSPDGTTWTAVAAANLINNAPATVTTSGRTWQIGYIGKQNFVRAALNVDGGTTSGALTIVTTAPITLGAGELTSSTTTATVHHVAHGFVVGQTVDIRGAVQAPYNVTGATIATVADADHFTYTFAGSGTSPATGTITATAHGGWTATGNSQGADDITVDSVGADTLTGTYAVSVQGLGTSAHNVVAKSSTGNGAVTVASPIVAVLAPYVNQTFRARCTAAASNAGTFTVYDPTGAALTPTVTVAGGATTIQIGGQNAFNLTIADGSSDFIVGDTIDITFDDLGVNVYKLTGPTGLVVGYPLGGTAFTSTQLNITVPDTSVKVTSAVATAAIVVTEGDAYGHIGVIKGNPLSGPLNSASITDKPQTLNS